MAHRWDRDRFERTRGSGEHEYYRFEERDRVGPRGRQEILVDEKLERRGPHGRFEERERYIEEDRHPARGPNPRFLDDPVSPETSRQALAPYRRPRPQFIRRQSSLDTFDRRPMPRYGDEYRMPPEVPIPLPIRRPHSPRRGQYYEEYEERYRDSDDEYRDIRIREERKGNHRSRSRMRSRSVRRRRSFSSSSDSSSDEINKSSIVGRRGRTKLPKRLAHKSAIIELGYPYVEEEHFIIVQRALDKSHIDLIVEKSKKYKEDKVVTYKYEGKTSGPAPAPKKQEKVEFKEARGEEVKKEEIKFEEIKPDGTVIKEKVELKETKPAALPVLATSPLRAVDSELIKKTTTTTTTTTTIDPPDHHHRHQDLAVVVPNRLSEHDIRRELLALEAERRALRYERDGDWELVEHRDRRKDIYRVERDRKGRMALVRSAH